MGPVDERSDLAYDHPPPHGASERRRRVDARHREFRLYVAFFVGWHFGRCVKSAGRNIIVRC